MTIEQLMEQLSSSVSEAKTSFLQTDSEPQLIEVRNRYLGKKGTISSWLKSMGKIPKEDRPTFGSEINAAKQQVMGYFEERMEELKRHSREQALLKEGTDVTLPARMPLRGSVHPLSRVRQEIETIFRLMGFDVAKGPHIENDWNNFEALNFPPNHPARDMQDTFLLPDAWLLRTHTSPVQIRTMCHNKPPIRVIAPGMVYRCDSDVTHSPMFSQVEGLLVDERVTFSELKGTLEAFAHHFFGPGTGVRLRPSYFPFTEPSAEVDIQCVFCKGKGCRICSRTGWIEILGAGMVDPNVFEQVGYDPDRYSGYAFGMGIERIAMLRYGISDIRLFFENDVRFLSQFA